MVTLKEPRRIPVDPRTAPKNSEDSIATVLQDVIVHVASTSVESTAMAIQEPMQEAA